ncbi:MAG: hypothetical protein WCJ58_01695 [bacterium]
MSTNLQFNTAIFIFTAVVIIIAFALLIAYIWRLNHRIKTLQTPRYGFLGKPLFPMFVVLLLTGSLLFVNYYNKQSQVTTTGAAKNVVFDINYKNVSQSGNNVTMKFDIEPKIEKLPWGGNDQNKFDIYWTLNGPENYQYLEVGKSYNKPSGFQISILSGAYTVKTKIVFEGKTYEYSEEIYVE